MRIATILVQIFLVTGVVILVVKCFGMEPSDVHGNKVAREGCDRCWCGCKYWENDRCIDCGTHATDSRVDRS